MRIALPDAPFHPDALGTSTRPRIVVLSASWCQWCKVLEAVTLPAPEVQAAIARSFEALHVDVDAAPLWMDLPDVVGLPALTFFDPNGRHVLTKSGYRDPDELVAMLDEIARRIATGELMPYRAQREVVTLARDEITPPRAATLLARLESAIFIAVNSNEGGFRSPARHPEPELLVELEAWRAHGAPLRVGTWVDVTMQSALRGGSPRLARTPQPDLGFSSSELRSLAGARPPYPARYVEGVRTLAVTDPWRGLQDPVDGGVFRYAATTGFYDPHFERIARDNIAWVMLLRMRGHASAAARIERYVRATFFDDDGVRASQASNPFYFRLRGDERRGVAAPEVSEVRPLDAAARAADMDPARCAALARLRDDDWPSHQVVTMSPDAADLATDDAVGVLLSAMSRCGGDVATRGAWIASVVVETWAREGRAKSPRLHTLARGVCDALPSSCARALASVEDVPFEPAYPPALVHLARIARR
jgi:hypothetical protein